MTRRSAKHRRVSSTRASPDFSMDARQEHLPGIHAEISVLK
jgi:hypothetical protein